MTVFSFSSGPIPLTFYNSDIQCLCSLFSGPPRQPQLHPGPGPAPRDGGPLLAGGLAAGQPRGAHAQPGDGEGPAQVPPVLAAGRGRPDAIPGRWPQPGERGLRARGALHCQNAKVRAADDDATKKPSVRFDVTLGNNTVDFVTVFRAVADNCFLDCPTMRAARVARSCTSTTRHGPTLASRSARTLSLSSLAR